MYFDLKTKLIPTGYYDIPTAIQLHHKVVLPRTIRRPVNINLVLSVKNIDITRGSPSVFISVPEILNTVVNAIG